MFKPMLAAVYDCDREACKYPNRFPLLGTPKIDGIRAMIVDGQLVSRSLKPIRNKRIKAIFEPILPEGADGELVCGDFYNTSSVVMSFNTEVPDNILFYWFDKIPANVNIPYEQRVLYIKNYVAIHKIEKVISLVPITLYNIDDVYKYEKEVLSSGFEGIMLRLPGSPYKHGRSTIKEGYLMKLKRFTDSEAVIVDTEELMHNMNDDNIDDLGYTKRSGARNGLVGGNMLGSIVALTPQGVKFKIGSGYTQEQRQEMWHSRHSLVGQVVKYKHIEYGKKDSPRSTVFSGLRHSDDMHNA